MKYSVTLKPESENKDGWRTGTTGKKSMSKDKGKIKRNHVYREAAFQKAPKVSGPLLFSINTEAQHT